MKSKDRNLSSITQDEVLAELARLHRNRPDGFTRRDVDAATGMSASASSALIRKLIASGRLEYIGRRLMPAVDGHMQPAPVYKPTGRT